MLLHHCRQRPEEDRLAPEADEGLHPIARRQQRRARPLPDPLEGLTAQRTQSLQYSNSQASRSAPVIANSSSLLGQAQAVQSRITEQHEASGGAEPPTPDPGDSFDEQDPFEEEEPAQQQPASAAKPGVQKWVDVQKQHPWKLSDSHPVSGRTDDAEEQAVTTEQQPAQLTVASETGLSNLSSNKPEIADAASDAQPELDSQLSNQRDTEQEHDQPGSDAAANEAVGQLTRDPTSAENTAASRTSIPSSSSTMRRSSASQPASIPAQADSGKSSRSSSDSTAVETEPGKTVMTSPLEDAAVPTDAAKQDTALRAESAQAASAPVPVETEDGRTVMTTPLQDAATMGDTASTSAADDDAAAQDRRADTDLDKSASAPVETEDGRTVMTTPVEDAADPPDEEEEAPQGLPHPAVEGPVEESQKPPAFASLDASRLDEPGDTCKHTANHTHVALPVEVWHEVAHAAWGPVCMTCCVLLDAASVELLTPNVVRLTSMLHAVLAGKLYGKCPAVGCEEAVLTDEGSTAQECWLACLCCMPNRQLHRLTQNAC